MLKRQKRPRALGPVWLRWVMFLGGSLCMGLAVAVAVQWVVTGSLSIVWEWFVKWPTYLLLTGVLYGAVVFTLGALLGRLWLSAILVGVAGLVLSLVDYFKTAINGTPLVLADFGLAAQVGEVAGVAGELRPPVDFWMAMIALGMCVGILILVRRLTLLTGRCRFVTFSVALALTIGLFSTQGAQAAGQLIGCGQVGVFIGRDERRGDAHKQQSARKADHRHGQRQRGTQTEQQHGGKRCERQQRGLLHLITRKADR